MRKTLHPSLTLGARKPYLSERQTSLSRLGMIMHTKVGDIPWRPEFGCDLTGLVGEPATPSRINETRAAVSGAIRRWLPDVIINECEVHLISSEGTASKYRESGIPIAESALVAMGTEARLELKIDLEIEDQQIELGTELDI
jgi:phage baseplate assembly protein W